MTRRMPPQDSEAVARKGREIYEQVIKPTLTAEDDGKEVIVDTLSGDYVVHEDVLTASTLLRERRPDGEFWGRRVGRLVRLGLGSTLRMYRAQAAEVHGLHPEEFDAIIRRGPEICKRVVSPAVLPEDQDKFVAFDLLSEDFEISHDRETIKVRLRERRPKAIIYVVPIARMADVESRDPNPWFPELGDSKPIVVWKTPAAEDNS